MFGRWHDAWRNTADDSRFISVLNTATCCFEHVVSKKRVRWDDLVRAQQGLTAAQARVCNTQVRLVHVTPFGGE